MNCWKCGREAKLSVAFCESCGARLKADLAVDAAVPGLTAAGVHKAGRDAAKALLAVAVLQVVFGAVMIYGTNTLPPTPPVFFTVFGIGAAFFGLFLWARRNPFPAAVVGLVLFVSVHLFEAVMDPHSLYRGLIMKAIVIVVLARAVSQTGRYRQLLRSSAGR